MSAEIAGEYILAGGRSRRMEATKPLSRGEGRRRRLGSRGDRGRHGTRDCCRRVVAGIPLDPGSDPEFGPVSGIASCLADTSYEWNLIVACDMPGVSREWLHLLLDSAEGDVLVPRSADGRIHPLCAVWNRRAAVPMTDATRAEIRAVKHAIRRLDWRTIAVTDEGRVANVNTPREWAARAGVLIAPTRI